MKVAFATPELQSLVRRTSLAELAENLPRTLMQQGVDVLVFLPWTLDIEDVRVMGLREVASYRVKDLDGDTEVKLHRGHVRELPVVLVDHTLFRERHPYGDENGPYLDNWRRYALFCRAILEGVGPLGFTPDVFHCFDWTVGLLPLLKSLEVKKGHPAEKAGTFFAIQNMAMQGSFEREVMPKIGIPQQYFRFTEGVELAGRVNYLKAGAEFASIIGASSPTMAKQLGSLNRGDGFEDTFLRREEELVGIRSGIDYRAWDPATDPLLAQTYAASQADPTAGKRKCKSTLQDGLKLENSPKVPIVAVITRFDSDGGFDVLAEALTPMLERSVQLVLMGPGAPEIHERIRTLEQTFAGRCRLIEGYDVNTAHTIMGGADALLLPAHYHASTTLCAIAQRYGVVPIAYVRSGLEDVIKDIRSDAAAGTGFLFEHYNADSLVEGIDELRALFKKASDWKELVKRCMSQDFSWQESGLEYAKAYKRVIRIATGQEKKRKKKSKQQRVVMMPEPPPKPPRRIVPRRRVEPESDEDDDDSGPSAPSERGASAQAAIRAALKKATATRDASAGPSKPMLDPIDVEIDEDFVADDDDLGGDSLDAPLKDDVDEIDGDALDDDAAEPDDGPKRKDAKGKDGGKKGASSSSSKSGKGKGDKAKPGKDKAGKAKESERPQAGKKAADKPAPKAKAAAGDAVKPGAKKPSRAKAAEAAPKGEKKKPAAARPPKAAAPKPSKKPTTKKPPKRVTKSK